MSDGWKCWLDNIQQDPARAKCADNSGIYGLDGNPWCQSNKLNLTPKEVKDAIAVMDSSEGGKSIVIGDEKYFVLRHESDHFVGKQNKKGLTVARGKQCVIIGLYDDHSTVNPGNNCKQVCKVKDQLMDLGY